MGEHTEIQWTDHTFNPWWGCTRVSEACQHCYAESLAKRFGTDWGKGAERRLFGDKHWNEPVRWNRKAEQAGKPETVFCASMADVFEDRPELVDQRDRLWELIGRTPWLTWQLLTKRPENIMGMVPSEWLNGWPANVWAGTTVENQRWADERLPHLLEVPAPVRFVSCEPLFGPLDLGLRIDLRTHERDHITTDVSFQCLDCSTEDEIVEWTHPDGLRDVDWVIAGGESGRQARPSHPDWFRSLRDQCQSSGVPFLFKQWGEWRPVQPDEWMNRREGDALIRSDGYTWPLRQPHGAGDELPSTVTIRKVGKKTAGRTLDGRTWDGIPPLSVPTCP